MEPALKHIVKKFPTIDVRGGGAGTQLVHNIRADILKSLQLYYYTFVDLLELRDHINELLTTIDACQLQLDFAINIDLTVHYLDLVTRYIALMILLSRVDDRKAVLGLYNTAYELQNNTAEPSFPRLGQMIIDYEQPLRKLTDEFVPHTRILYNALASLNNVYARRNLTAKDWREAQMLSITAAPLQILQASQTETIACEYVSLERMERWVIFGLMISHGVLGMYTV